MNLNAIAASVGAAGEPVDLTLGDSKVTVLPQMDWKVTALDAIQRGDFRSWAKGAFKHDEAGRDGSVQWDEADPTVAQLIGFFSDYSDATGISLGESVPSQRL